jgi:hypothetical protein
MSLGSSDVANRWDFAAELAIIIIICESEKKLVRQVSPQGLPCKHHFPSLQ